MIIKCPICNSSKTKKSSEGFSKRPTAGENYLKNIDFDFEKNQANIHNSIPLFICLNCGAGWRGDSELSKSIDYIYHKSHSLHWTSFTIFKELFNEKSERKDLDSFLILINLFASFTNKKVDLIELGSPLLGFGFKNADLKHVKQLGSHNRKILNFDFILLLQEKLTVFQINLYSYLIKIKKIIKGIFTTKKLRKKLISKDHKINKIRFYDIPTSIGWGVSSIICGHSTLKWLIQLNPDVELINKYTAKDYSSDLSICVNYLDHFDSPIIVIKEMLEFSKIIIFSLHKQKDAGIQHKYTFSDTFDSIVTNLLPKEYLCIKLSEEIIDLKDYRNFNYFIAGDRTLLNNFKNYIKNKSVSI